MVSFSGWVSFGSEISSFNIVSVFSGDTGLCSIFSKVFAKCQVDFLLSSFNSFNSTGSSVLILSVIFRNSCWAAIASSRARCFSLCSICRRSVRISRLYDGSPGKKILASSAVSYSEFLRGIPFAFKKSVSKDMKCPTIVESPMNFTISSFNSSILGASFTSSSVIFVM